jgi:CysZ protein
MKKPGFVSGINYFLRGFKLINLPGVRRFVVIPLTINIVLFTAALWFGISYIDGWLTQIQNHFKGSFTGWLEWVNTLIEWVSWVLIPLFILVYLAIAFYTFTLFANLIAAPFNSLLAEKIEAHLSGKPPTTGGNMMDMLKDIGGSILSELRKLLYFALRAIPLLILFLIPVVNIAAGFLWFVFSAWMLAIEYSDYPMGNHDMRFPHQRQTLRQNRMFALGFGTATVTATMIPFVNFFAMPVAVAASTAMWVDHWRDNVPQIPDQSA